MKTIYQNAVVYTGALPFVEAFVVEEDRFIYAGTREGAMAHYEPGDVCEDLHGAFVCAGFHDSHMHLLGYGQTLQSAPLHQHTESLAEMLCCLREHAERNPGGWILGRGWNQDYFRDTPRMPTRWDLDQVSGDRPVCAVRACGHALAVNSCALKILGITTDTISPEGGEIGRTDGEPNGLFFDNAMDLVYQAFAAPDRESVKQILRAACRALNQYGVTACQSDDYCVFSALPWQEVNAAFRELEAAGELSVRVYEQCNFSGSDDLRAFLEAGNVTGRGSDFFRIGPLKLLGDGALGPRTAYLSAPYADAPDTCGIPVFSQETFDEMISLAHENGMQTAVHAIGDACLDRVLGAMERAMAKTPREDPRHGIVHCQITRPDQLERIAALGLHVYAQSIFLDYDTGIVEARVGAERATSSYSWKSLMRRGVTVSNGTDAPVEQPFALGGIQCAVTRQNLAGTVAPYLPGEAFTVQEALLSYTAASARACFG